jgi:hypothetical protein
MRCENVAFHQAVDPEHNQSMKSNNNGQLPAFDSASMPRFSDVAVGRWRSPRHMYCKVTVQ